MTWRPDAGVVLVLLASCPAPIWSQFESGTLRGAIRDSQGQALAGVAVKACGVPSAFEVSTRSGADGRFEFRLPYGDYRLAAGESACRKEIVHVPAFGSACVEVTATTVATCGTQAETLPPSGWPETYGMDGLIVNLEPSVVTQPLNLTGLTSNPLSLMSQRGFSWTETAFGFAGVDATDAYQPGRPAMLADTSALEAVAVRQAYGPQILALPRALTAEWHFNAATSDSGSALASNNLPAPLGLVQQSEHYQWFTRDHLDAGGPVGRRVALFVSETGQWAKQTVPFEPPGSNLGTRLILSNARVTFHATNRDRVEGYFSGAESDLSNWGTPAGIEGLVAIRGGAELAGGPSGGFPNTPEHDRLDNAAAGWNHTGWGGELQVRLGVSSVSLETSSDAPAGGQSRVDMLDGITNGVGPLASTGDRTRLRLAADYLATPRMLGRSRHLLTAGIEGQYAGIHNRITAPSNMNLITADGVPAFEVALNTPSDSRESIESLRGYVRDDAAVTSWLTVSLAGVLDAARGGPISWTNFSPQVGFSATPGKLRRLALVASYARLYSPLAGRYLDFGNPNSLGGIEYQYQPGLTGLVGPEILTFGGPYSSIDPGIKRPYADQYDVGLHARLPWNIAARLDLFRRNEKNRIAALDTGIPASAFSPVQVTDPGPDGVVGTFDDQTLTVYAQSPSTFGMDHYLLTNPAGLEQLDEGMVAQLSTDWKGWQAGASLMAVKSYGPTNPGNSPLENDPGVIGTLFMDPNSSINAAGRAYFDRAYVGKLHLLKRLPKWLGGIEWANTVTYMDGLPFARLLLVNGLPQGPVVVQASVHGSPGGGNRAEHVLNWNLRLARTFAVGERSLRLGTDVLNAANANDRIQEIDITWASFNSRLPEAIQTARFARVFVEFGF